MFSGKTKTSLFLSYATELFLLSDGFYLGTRPCNPLLPSIFLIVEAWTLTLTETSEACSPLDVVGSFVTYWVRRHCALGVILVGWPLGRFTTALSFHHLALTAACWSPKALQMEYNLFQVDRSVTLFLICSWVSVDFRMLSSFLGCFGPLHFVKQVLFNWFLDWGQVWQ